MSRTAKTFLEKVGGTSLVELSDRLKKKVAWECPPASRGRC